MCPKVVQTRKMWREVRLRKVSKSCRDGGDEVSESVQKLGFGKFVKVAVTRPILLPATPA